MKTAEIAQQITPGRKIFTFSKDEVKEIMLKATNEVALTKEEMYYRVMISIDDGHGCNRDWALILSVEKAVESP